jgi:HD-GYP domain-containing protein (c-di-GMP phosphodiesterase class II)
MSRQVSLTTRAFLLAAIPMALTLVVSFILVGHAVEGRVKDRLRESLRRTEALVSQGEADNAHNAVRALSAFTESTSLKSGVALLQETREPEFQAQLHDSLAGQLLEMGEASDYELLLLEDDEQKPLLGVVDDTGKGRLWLRLDERSTERVAPSLFRIDGTLYESVSAPITVGSTSLGNLVVGKKLNIGGWSQFGGAALFQGDQVLLSTFSGSRNDEVRRQIATRCSADATDCEVRVGDETYLTLVVRRETFRDGVRLISFQSIDEATREFTDNMASVLLSIGGGGVLLVLLLSALGARSISRPVVDLIARLRRVGSATEFSTELQGNYNAVEVNEIAQVFNRAAGAVRESERRLDEAAEQFIESMAQAQDARDPYTAGHSERVSYQATEIGRIMGLSAEQIEIIRIGAKLHDIGKIGIPDAVLRKPEKLTREEYSLIQQHPRIGKEILEKVRRFHDFIPIVELHHENPDGSGYPYGLRKDDIPLPVRIVHVVDVFDAITSDRAYRQAMSEAQAWALIRKGTGTLFDPQVVEALWTVLHEKPERSSVIIEPHENDLAYYPLRTY